MINLTEQREGRRALVSPDRDVDGGRADSVRQRGGRHALFCQRRTIHPLTMSLPLCALPPSIASHRTCECHARGMHKMCTAETDTRTHLREGREMDGVGGKERVGAEEGGRAPIDLHPLHLLSFRCPGGEDEEGRPATWEAGRQPCMLCYSPLPCPCASARPGMCFYDGNIFAAQRVPSRESQLLYSPPTLPSLCSSTAPSHVPPIDILFHHQLVYEFPTGWRASCNETSP